MSPGVQVRASSSGAVVKETVVLRCVDRFMRRETR